MKRYNLFLSIIFFSSSQAMYNLPELVKSMGGMKISATYRKFCTLEPKDFSVFCAKNKIGQTTLHDAVLRGDKKLVTLRCDDIYTLSACPEKDILMKDEDGMSAWGYAIESGKVEIVKAFLEAFGNNVMDYLTEREGWQGMTPLHIAVNQAQEHSCSNDIYLKYKEIIQLLLNAAGPDAPWLVIAVNNESRTPLVYADDEIRGILLKVLGLSSDINWGQKE